MAITNIKITLTDGQKYKLRTPSTLSEINKNRTAIFLFDNMKVYEGQSDGEVDEDGDFVIFKPNVNFGAGMPYNRLVGWAYKRGGNAGTEGNLNYSACRLTRTISRRRYGEFGLSSQHRATSGRTLAGIVSYGTMQPDVVQSLPVLPVVPTTNAQTDGKVILRFIKVDKYETERIRHTG